MRPLDTGLVVATGAAAAYWTGHPVQVVSSAGDEVAFIMYRNPAGTSTFEVWLRPGETPIIRAALTG